MITKLTKRIKRHRRVRAKVKGTQEMPRVAVFRSNRYITGQIIDDTSGKTLVSITDAPLVGQKSKGVKAVKSKSTKTQRASELGEQLAKKAKTAGIEKVVFDRGGYLYHGRIKAFAEGLRKGGLIL